MDLHSIISYHPHPHRSLHKFKKKKISASVALHVTLSWWPQSQCSSLLPCMGQFWSKPSTSESPHRRIGGGTSRRSALWGDAHSVWLRDLANIVVSRGHSRWCPAYVESEQALLNTTEVTQQQCSVSFGWQPTNDLTSLPVDLWGWGRDAEWALGVAGGEGCRNERRGSSASEVGTVDGTAKKKKKKKVL